MFKMVLVAVGLFYACTAQAADIGDLKSPEQERAEGFFATAQALPGSEAKEAEDAALAERMAALEAAQAGFAAKVVVLEWQGADVGYDNMTVQRNIRSRIARPDAKFYPEIDLYQAGRREPDRTVSAADQRGTVPDEAVDSVMYAVHDIESVPWNGLTEADWGITANNLRAIAEDIWFVDRPELREPMFQLYVQIGRAAENMNNPVAPFYQHLGGQLVNYYWYLAGVLAYEDAELMANLSDAELYSSIEYYSGLLANQSIPFMTLSFEYAGLWDAKKFASDYQLFINGMEVLVTDSQSLLKVPPGRIDLYMKRTDGHSISDRIELDKLGEKIYFVRDVARKRMGIDFIDQLMKHPNECTPRVDGDILTYLAIYATLHPEAEIYIGVPVGGDPNDILLWRWNREQKTLTKVLDETGGYPIRFAILGGVGMAFSGANVDASCPFADENMDGIADACPVPEPSLTVSGMPFYLQLRMHYSRLMIPFGVQANLTLGAYEEGDLDSDGNPGEGLKPWSDNFQTQGHEFTRQKEVIWSRLFYTGIGVVLAKKAALGIGPRGYVRVGWWNVPHLIDLTFHAGITMEPPGMEQDGRVRFLVDIDGFIGPMIPFGQTVISDPLLSFGVEIGAGTTF